MSTLADTIQAQDWQKAALCLIWGLAQALSQVPPDTIHGLLEALTEPPRRH